MDGSNAKAISNTLLSPGEAAAIYGVTQVTLRRWAACGGLKGHIKTIGGQLRYPRPVLDDAARSGIIYARVSSAKQKPDLQRQVDYLRARFPGYEVVTDIASGVHFRRKGLFTVLDRCDSGAVSEVVVAHRDRLARIAFPLVEHLINRAGSVLTVVEDLSCDGCAAELQDDLMAILTHFTAKHNGRRSYRDKKDQGPPERGPEGAPEAVRGRAQVPVERGQGIRGRAGGSVSR
jgi:predicted site-specific integrase-resolvase